MRRKSDDQRVLTDVQWVGFQPFFPLFLRTRTVRLFSVDYAEGMLRETFLNFIKIIARSVELSLRQTKRSSATNRKQTSMDRTELMRKLFHLILLDAVWAGNIPALKSVQRHKNVFDMKASPRRTLLQRVY